MTLLRRARPLLLLAIAVFGGCTGGPAPGPSPLVQRNGTLTLGLPAVGTLDPATASMNGLLVLAMACEPLLALDPDTLEPEPALVQSWQYKADARSVTLQLRKGLRLQDGEPFDSKTVADSLSRIANPATSSPWAPLVVSMASVRPIRPTSIEIAFNRPDADFVTLLAHPALTPVSILADGTQVCVGPYRMEAGTEGAFRFSAFENHEPITGFAEEIVVRHYENNDAAFEALKNGEVDLAPIAETRAAGGEAEGWRQESAVGNAVTYLAFNPSRPETANPALRQAVSRALDRLAIIDVGFGDGRLPLSGWNAAGSGSPQSPECREAAPRNADPEGAAQKLAESGVSPGATFPMYFDQSRLSRLVANSIEVQVKSALGVILRSEPTDAAGLDSTLRGGTIPGVWILNSESDSPVPGRLLSRLFETGSSSNIMGFSDAPLDTALAAARTKVDTERRLDAYAEAEEIVCGYMIAAPLWTGIKHWVFDSEKVDVEGPALDPWGNPILRHVKPR